MGPGFSIRYKFLAVTTLLLAIGLGAYLQLATWEFKQDKTEWVYDYNRSVVSNLSSDIETLFLAAEDKMRLVAYFYRAQDQRSLSMVRELLAHSQDLVFVGGSDSFRNLDRSFYHDESFLETYGLEEGFFSAQGIFAQRPIPFEVLRREGEALWNATVPGGPPLIGFAKNVVEEDLAGRSHSQYAVVGLIQADRLLAALSRPQLNEVFVVNRYGELILHPQASKEDQWLSSSRRETPVANSETGRGEEHEPLKVDFAQLVEQAHSLKVPVGVMTYREGDQEMLGAFAKVLGDQLIVLSRVSEEKAFAVVAQLQRRSWLFAIVVLSMAFLAAILFSRSLTRPIDVLMGGIQKVAQGDLQTNIPISSRDEMAILTQSFNRMIEDLRQSRQELEEINRDLEEKVAARTRQLELQNQAVKRAQEALLRTTRLAAAGEIAGRAAHEVLNPLTAIVARLQKLKDRVQMERLPETELLGQLTQSWEKDIHQGGLDHLLSQWQQPSQVMEGKSLWEEDLIHLQHIQGQLQQEWSELQADTDLLLKSSARINKIVQSMRSLSAVKSELKAQPIPDLVQDSVNIMADWAAEQKVGLTYDSGETSEQPLEALVDGDEFIQSLTNLIRNAIQAVAERKKQDSHHQGEVQVSLQVQEGKISVLVQDNGVGIRPEHQAQLFENQFTTKSREQGTGLGLNISRRFVRAFGGDIFLQSSEWGHGSVFVIELPAHSSHETSQQQGQVPA